MKIKNETLFNAFFFAICFCLLLLVEGRPIADFGNYYYGSRIFSDHGDASLLYNDVHGFNEEVKTYGESDFFGNYLPVPPFSVLFYYPFIFLSPQSAKLAFNLFSLVLLYLCLRAFRKQFKVNVMVHLAALCVLIMPLYYNLLHGQLYIIIAAMLLWTYIAYLKRQYIVAGALIALIFHLKIFPAFVLIYFIIRKEYRVVGWCLLFAAILFFCTWAVVGGDVMWNYYIGSVPRLMKNEIVEPFYYGHQSIHILLQNLFVYDGLYNPSPLLNAPLVASVIEAVTVSVLCYFVFQIVRAHDNPQAFGIVVFLGLLVNKYLPAYSLFLLLPFATATAGRRTTLVFLLIGIASNFPLTLVSESFFLLKFLRVLILLGAFLLVINNYASPVFNVKLAILVALFGLITPNLVRSENNYLTDTKTKGVYYDMNIAGSSIVLSRCMGNVDYRDTVRLSTNVESIALLKSHPLLQKGTNKSIHLLNNNILVYLSDFQQGLGVLRPRFVLLR